MEMVAQFCKVTKTHQAFKMGELKKKWVNFVAGQVCVNKYLKSFASEKSVPELPYVPGWE